MGKTPGLHGSLKRRATGQTPLFWREIDGAANDLPLFICRSDVGKRGVQGKQPLHQWLAVDLHLAHPGRVREGNEHDAHQLQVGEAVLGQQTSRPDRLYASFMSVSAPLFHGRGDQHRDERERQQHEQDHDLAAQSVPSHDEGFVFMSKENVGGSLSSRRKNCREGDSALNFQKKDATGTTPIAPLKKRKRNCY